MLRMAKRLAANTRSHPGLPPLIALTDPARMPDPAGTLAQLARGSALIWRCYGAPPTRAALAELSRSARRRGVLLLIAGEARPAASNGVHYPEHALLGGRKASSRVMTSAAAHSESAIIRAGRAGVDLLLISPVFATDSHPGAHGLGLVRFARLARMASRLGMAAFALGGVTNLAALRRLSGSGAHGVAGIGFIDQA